MIQRGDMFHLEWAKVCHACSKRIKREGGPVYICQTKAR